MANTNLFSKGNLVNTKYGEGVIVKNCNNNCECWEVNVFGIGKKEINFRDIEFLNSKITEKQIPKKPIFEINCVQIDGVTYSGCPVCPTCKEPTYSLDVCHFCGQHLENS